MQQAYNNPPPISSPKRPRHEWRYASDDPLVQTRRALKRWYGSGSRFDLNRLAYRHAQILGLHAAGLSYRQIAKRLGYNSHGFLHAFIQKRMEEDKLLLNRVDLWLHGAGLFVRPTSPPLGTGVPCHSFSSSGGTTTGRYYYKNLGFSVDIHGQKVQGCVELHGQAMDAWLNERRKHMTQGQDDQELREEERRRAVSGRYDIDTAVKLMREAEAGCEAALRPSGKERVC